MINNNKKPNVSSKMFSPENLNLIYNWILSDSGERVVEVIQNGKTLELGEQLSYQTSYSLCAPSNVETRSFMIHTHPLACYRRNRINHAWPSGEDYKSILKNSLKYHIVVSSEGFYIITNIFDEDISWNTLKKSERNYIKQTHNIAGNAPIDEYRYVYHINSLGYFHIKFVSWTELGFPDLASRGM